MLVDRLKGVFMLNAKTFQEIEHDQNATGQATMVVFGAALINGLLSGGLFGSGNFFGAFVGGLIGTVLGWLLWSLVTWQIGSRMGAKTDFNEMLRVIGFANAPRVIPIIGFFWSLAAAFVGTREGLDLDTGKTLITVGVGFVAMILLSIVLGIFGLPVDIFGMFG